MRRGHVVHWPDEHHGLTSGLFQNWAMRTFGHHVKSEATRADLHAGFTVLRQASHWRVAGTVEPRCGEAQHTPSRASQKLSRLTPPPPNSCGPSLPVLKIPLSPPLPHC